MLAQDRQFHVADDGRTIFSTSNSGRHAFFIPDGERLTARRRRTIINALSTLLAAGALVGYLVLPRLWLWAVVLAAGLLLGMFEMRRWAASRFAPVIDPKLIEQLRRSALLQTAERDLWIRIALSLYFVVRGVEELTSAGPDWWSMVADFVLGAAMIRLTAIQLLERRGFSPTRAGVGPVR